MSLFTEPHRRYNPLTGEWVLVSPHRTQRPWQGQVEKTPRPAALQYDPECYLCPGNARAGGRRNPDYSSTFTFDNDFPALKIDTPPEEQLHRDLLVARAERGVCRVVCFHPDHSLSVSRMSQEQIAAVVRVWREQYAELGANQDIRSVQIFENRGEMMGASNPHPHCQIWATESVPGELLKESTLQRQYFLERETLLLRDYLELEMQSRDRLISHNKEFAVLAPFWAVWPFETIILPFRPVPSLLEMDEEQHFALAGILGDITARYDRVFDAPFPYSMGFHQRPTDSSEYPFFCFHAHFYPPLLRSATVRKFMAGFELLGDAQRDITPEAAAQRLREV